MREFMNYITNAFYGATGWNEDNKYNELNATSRGARPTVFLCHYNRIVTERLIHKPNHQISLTFLSPVACA